MKEDYKVQNEEPETILQQIQEDLSDTVWIKHFDVKVPIKGNLKKGLIFGLNARLSIGIFLSFLDFRHVVIHLMQKLSHSTRAYIWNADGLNSFLQRVQIMKVFREAQRTMPKIKPPPKKKPQPKSRMALQWKSPTLPPNVELETW